MQIHGVKASLARARMVRSARRKGMTKVLSGRKNTSSSGNTNRIYSTGTDTKSNSASKKITMYETVQKSADALQKNVKELVSYKDIKSDTATTDEVSKKTEDTDRKKMISYIKDFVENYNDMYDALGELGGSVNQAFQKQLTSQYTSEEKALDNIGITKKKDGTLSIDTKKLEAAGIGDLKKIFSAEDSYASKVSDQCKSIEESADATIRVLNKMYGSTQNYSKYGIGSYYYGSSGNRYSSWG